MNCRGNLLRFRLDSRIARCFAKTDPIEGHRARQKKRNFFPSGCNRSTCTLHLISDVTPFARTHDEHSIEHSLHSNAVRSLCCFPVQRNVQNADNHKSRLAFFTVIPSEPLRQSSVVFATRNETFSLCSISTLFEAA